MTHIKFIERKKKKIFNFPKMWKHVANGKLNNEKGLILSSLEDGCPLFCPAFLSDWTIFSFQGIKPHRAYGKLNKKKY